MGIIIISFVDLLGTKNKEVSEIGLICIYTLSATHCRRTIVITCMFSGICCISIRSFLIIWIWSWNLFTYFIASLRNYCTWSFFSRLASSLMNATFALVIRVFQVVLSVTTHYSLVCFYFRAGMNSTINMIRWVHSTLQTTIVDTTSRLKTVTQMRVFLLCLVHHWTKLSWILSVWLLLLLGLINVLRLLWLFSWRVVWTRLSLYKLWMIS